MSEYSDLLKQAVGALVVADVVKYQRPDDCPMERLMARIERFDYMHEATEGPAYFKAEAEMNAIAAEAVSMPWQHFGEFLSAAHREGDRFEVMGSRKLQTAMLDAARMAVKEQYLKAVYPRGDK